MSALVMFTVAALIGLASLLCNSGAWLWMASKWCRIPNVSYLRALGTIALISAINLILRVTVLDLPDRPEASAGIRIVACILLMIVADTLCISRVLRTTARRALGAGVIMIFVSGVVAVPVLIVLRHFVMESFVVPTGSMAPAVIGKHFDVTCPHCGLPFFLSANERFQMQQRARGKPTAGYFDHPGQPQIGVCPNCRARFALSDDLRIADGDRILVDKLSHPHRWAPVVFQSPEHFDSTHVQRLVGLPGETVEIAGGDIFINGRRQAKPFGVAHELWVLVNDTNFRPADLRSSDPQWRAAEAVSHWQQIAGNWKFPGPDAAPETLVFSGPLDDESYYSERWAEDAEPLEFEPPKSIGDLQVTCTLTYFSGAGAIRFRWKFQGLEAVANVTTGGVVELQSGNEIKEGRLTGPISAVKSVGFAVRDRIGIFFADGREVARLVIGPQDIESAREALKDEIEPCQIAIMADHCDLEFSRILLERDVYYRSDFPDCNGCIGRPIALGAHEHYVLGDHSPRANDSRLWRTTDDRLGNRYQAGTVPTELVIGTARCIYWPPRRWREFR